MCPKVPSHFKAPNWAPSEMPQSDLSTRTSELKILRCKVCAQLVPPDGLCLEQSVFAFFSDHSIFRASLRVEPCLLQQSDTCAGRWVSVLCLLLWQALPSPDETGIALTTRIARLKAVKQEALAKKKATAKSLKAAQKKLKKGKAALTMLSDEDLMHAVTERQANKADQSAFDVWRA